jgi:hypothetical protein
MIQISGWNDFYEGWLANVMLLPNDNTKSLIWQDGWQTAHETGEMAILALVPEIRQGHIKIAVIAT